MNAEEASVAMLHQGPHPAHRGFAEAIDADLVDYRGYAKGRLADSFAADLVNGLRYPPYDVYLVEGSRPLYAAMVNRLRGSARVIYLCADHGFYDLGQTNFDGDSPAKSLVGRFGLPVVRAVGRWGIDGAIAVSSFAAEYCRPFLASDAPLAVAHPFVQPEKYDELLAVEPAYDEPVAVTVGRGSHYKGIDRLVAAWPTVRESHPDARLLVVGADHPARYEVVQGVEVAGYVESLPNTLADASLFVQPSRVDAFPVSTLEAMCAGLPPLVTETTGTRSEAREVDAALVCESDESGLASGVIDYFDRSVDERRALGRRARERGRRFDADSRTDAFADAFEAVLEAL